MGHNFGFSHDSGKYNEVLINTIKPGGGWTGGSLPVLNLNVYHLKSI